MTIENVATVIIKNDCPMGRYKAGEIGTLLPNDFDKYDYKIELLPAQVSEGMREMSTFMPTNGVVSRVYYFRASEVDLVPKKDEEEDEDYGFSPR